MDGRRFFQFALRSDYAPIINKALRLPVQLLKGIKMSEEQEILKPIEVKYSIDEPAMELKFIDGILHQLFIVTIYSNSKIINVEKEWRIVPHESALK
jgi:hypothetical protein